jgi:putative ABC transport system ATP-binding protein
MKTQQKPITALNVEQIIKSLPPKKLRSHHVLIKMDHVSKEFPVGKGSVKILKDIDFNIYSGEFAIFYGPSGCGKSTILHTILGLEPPTSGQMLLRGEDVYKMTSDQRTIFRREKIGIVFQQFNWIKSLRVWENVAYPLYLSGYSEARAKERALEVLQEVDMVMHAGKKPTELSGGQQQRIAIARALTTDPWIILADEPTGSLDTESSSEVISLLARLNRDKRRLVVMVTHEMAFLPIATRRIGIRDGMVVYDEHDE